MRSLLAAIAFLTRVPVGRFIAFDSANVSHSSGWFPLIGVLLGTLYAVAAAPVKNHLPTPLVAALLVSLDAALTGGLHFDGLADTADGFGAGRNREEILRIMRDHSIGSYGGVALALAVALKVTANAALLRQSNWLIALILTPALGRWSILLLTAALPYARPSASVVRNMGRWSLFWGTVIVALPILAARSLRAWIAIAIVVGVTSLFGLYCRRRLAGITGDILGANLQLCEIAALLTFVWL